MNKANLTKREIKLLQEAVDGAIHWHYCFLMDGGQYEESNPERKRSLDETQKRLKQARQVIEHLKSEKSK